MLGQLGGGEVGRHVGGEQGGQRLQQAAQVGGRRRFDPAADRQLVEDDPHFLQAGLDGRPGNQPRNDGVAVASEAVDVDHAEAPRLRRARPRPPWP